MGLHGRAFVPMLSGFACAVPAIMATRTMERQRDRLLTMLVVPLMTCSARLPVYTLIIAAAVSAVHACSASCPVQGLLMVGMYGFAPSPRCVVGGACWGARWSRPAHAAVLELPPYRLPSLRGTLYA